MKFNKLNSLSKKLLQVLGILFLLQVLIVASMAAVTLFFPAQVAKVMAQFLIFEEPLQKSDVIVVIGGSENYLRFDRTIELYKAGYGKQIIISGAGEDSLVKPYFIGQGVPERKILFENISQTTYDNAVNVKKFTDQNKIFSFILVTSPDQSRRARMTFDRYFRGSNVRICSAVCKHSKFEPNKILQVKTSKTLLVTEWAKYVYYFLGMDHAKYNQHITTQDL